MSGSIRSFLALFRGQPKRRHSCRPVLEVLENRWVPSASGSISGHVLVDQTGNGLSADDVAGLKHVKVTVYFDSNHNGRLDHHDRKVKDARTDADGAYAFNHLKAGTYFVVEKVPQGYVRTEPVLGSYRTVELAAGQSVDGQDFDNFKKLSTDVVTHVRYTILDPSTGTTRTVRNLHGNTHEGDVVTVTFDVARRAKNGVVLSFAAYNAPSDHFDPKTASEQVLADSVTDSFARGEHGSLTITVPSGFYQVDFVVGPVIDHFGPARSNIFYSAQGRLIGADNGGSEATAPTTQIGGTVFADNNRNNLFDSGDLLYTGLTVTLSGSDNHGPITPVTTTTDAGGLYHFGSLGSGTYTVTVSLPDGSSLSKTVSVPPDISLTLDFAGPPADGGMAA